MSQSRPRANGVPAFAGLRSFFAAGPRAEEPKDTDQEDEEARKARRAEEDRQRDEEDARRAEEDQRREEEDARRAEEDDKAPKDPEGKKAKGKADEDDETCEDESDDEDKKAAKAAGRAAERVRWTNALNDPAVAPHAASACVMLATTNMHSSAVIAAVKALGPSQPQGGRGRIDQRMQTIRTANPGSGDAPQADANSPAAKAAAIVAAGRKRRGEI
jgi:hypothetical protein